MSSSIGTLPSWIAALSAALERDGRATLVTVAGVTGSAPRESGTTMVVTRDTVHGTIGGGHLEFEAIRIARDALSESALATWIVRFPLAARLGQCCGGVAKVAFSTLDRSAAEWIDAVAASARANAAIVLVSHVDNGEQASRRLLVSADDVRGSLGDSTLDSAIVAMARARLATNATGASLVATSAATTLLMQIERPEPFRILVFGNGHVGRALVRVLSVLPAQIQWIDSREGDFPPDMPENVEIVVTDVPEAELREAPAGAFVVVMTHSHALDFALIDAALGRDDWSYLGLIGSKAKRAQFEKRLAAGGHAPEALARIVCPIGLRAGGIRSKEPGAIAVAVAAELLQMREAVTAHSLPGVQSKRRS